MNSTASPLVWTSMKCVATLGHALVYLAEQRLVPSETFLSCPHGNHFPTTRPGSQGSMSTNWESSSFKPHGGHTCEQRTSSARRTRASPRRQASSSSRILSPSSVSAETGTASRVSRSRSRSTNRCGPIRDATSRSQAMRPARPRTRRGAEAGRAPEIAARLVRRVGLGAEAVEARTLFDCHIWPECRGKLALGSRDRREKEGRRCFSLGEWHGQVVRRRERLRLHQCRRRRQGSFRPSRQHRRRLAHPDTVQRDTRRIRATRGRHGSRGHPRSAPLANGKSVTVSSPRAISSEFRCGACGYGIIVSGALPTCPMCRATSWKSMRDQSGRSENDARHDTRKG